MPSVGRTASLPGLHFSDTGELVAKPNYHQARKQKELARKAASRRSSNVVRSPERSDPETSQVEASHSARSDYRERNVNPARFSAAARQERMTGCVATGQPRSRCGSPSQPSNICVWS